MGNAKKRRPWSYSTGEHGRNRVRAFDRGEKGIYLEYRAPDDRTGESKRVRIALKHSDRERAKAQADEVALRFRQEEKRRPVELTLKTLFDMYEREVSSQKGESKQKHDARCAEMFLRFFGATRRPETLSRRDWDRFIADRRKGVVAPKGVSARKEGTEPRTVRERVIAYDLKYLIAVLNWATLAGDGHGGVLLDRNPLKGLQLPREESPRRPVLTTEQYQQLLKAAPEVSPLLVLALVVAHETGHRIGAIRTLQWSDIDFDKGAIRWRAENDKIGFEHTQLVSAECLSALRDARRALPAIGDAWVFPAPGNAARPISRHLARDWWERAARVAELPEGQRLGWHSLRRQYATEMKHVPLKDLCYMGGWKNPQTLLTSYQQPDEATQRRALSERKELHASGLF